jgi:K+-sensing histidine kinase KdpD
LINSVIQKLAIPYKQTIVFKPNENLPLFKFDRGLIEQVLQNLLHNAINYTPENTIIKIVASQQLSNCVLSVSDNGKGIPKDGLDKIFDIYGRIKQDIEGQGIGLYLAKKIINAAGGEIIVESEPGIGSDFMIHIKTVNESQGSKSK